MHIPDDVVGPGVSPAAGVVAAGGSSPMGRAGGFWATPNCSPNIGSDCRQACASKT